MINLTIENVKQLVKNIFSQLTNDQMAFFDLRECLAVFDNSTQFKNGHQVELTTYDHDTQYEKIE